MIPISPLQALGNDEFLPTANWGIKPAPDIKLDHQMSKYFWQTGIFFHPVYLTTFITQAKDMQWWN